MEAFPEYVTGGAKATGVSVLVMHVPLDSYECSIEYAVKTTEVLVQLMISD